MAETSEQDTQARIRKALETGRPFGVDGPVETIETHIAVVFLVADRAFKMKKVKALGYLDFFGADNRHALLEKELRLNSRTAPHLYRAVVPVTQARDGSLTVGGEGQALEWLLEMRRFDQHDLLARRLEPHPGLEQPSESLAVPLAEAIAALHRKAERCRIAGWHEAVAGVLENITGHVAAGAGRPLDPEAVERFAGLSQARLNSLGPMLEERARGGHVRRCHGDLHLANIVVQDGRPVLFDCIEFNDEIACQDTLYDMAFLLMDLVFRDRRDFGNRVFNAYISGLNDFDRAAALPVVRALPFYGALRAAIRCHVCLARLNEVPADEGEHRTEVVDQARAYLELALTLLAPPPPRIVAVGGLSGSGKSTLARDLGGAFGGLAGALILRTDEIRKRLHGAPLGDALPAAAYTPEASAAVYRVLADEAAVAIGAGLSVLVDGVFARPDQRKAIAALADRLGVPFHGLWLSADPAIMAARVRGRRGDVSDATEDVLERQLGFDLGAIDWIRLDSGPARAHVVREACRTLGLGGERGSPV